MGTRFTASAHEDNAFATTQEVYYVPVIMYHSVRNKGLGKYVVSPKTFEDDLLYIKENDYTPIAIADLLAYQNKRIKLPEKPIIITLDDGYADNYSNVFPILKKHNVKAIISVIGKTIDDNYTENGNLKNEPQPYMSYEKISELHRSKLVEIANHTYNMHQAKGRLGLKKNRNESPGEYKEVLTSDLLKLQDNLRKKAEVIPMTVTFPFGEYSRPYTIDIIKELGFKASFTCYEGINKVTKTSSLHELCRYNRPETVERERFFGRIFTAVEKARANDNK